eukprot:TRINITY_DN67093_c0_g1_i1.p1 TRINITY_DN67093_c0_g1~~TRINITY_DN67093_c0_g1_i1.p1  ORF type:complete len:372 (+),score=49.06 TRINITY_DN67093_c0_g1_i1:72-1187(+)
MQDAAQPLTSRSAPSLSETSQSGLGGGFTSRSGGEKGTPREPQRLALGERPRDNDVPRMDWVRPSSHSPQDTARSAALSSDPWSMTPSSQGDGLSSRSRSDSVTHQYDDAIGLQIRDAFASADARGRQTDSRESEPHYQIDLSKSLEVMRFVIMKENLKLRERMQQTHDNITELRKELEAAGPSTEQVEGSVEPNCSAAIGGRSALVMAESNHVEWRIEQIDINPSKTRNHREVARFRLPMFPDMDFTLTFHANSVNGDGPPSCDVIADVSGSIWSRLALRIMLSLTIEMNNDNKSELDAGAKSASAVVLLGGRADSRASCTVKRPWPRFPSRATDTEEREGGGIEKVAVVCRVEVQEVSSRSGKLCLQGD